MDEKQADQRIILSRRRLHAGDTDPATEARELQAIAEMHPGKAEKIGRLIARWAQVAGRRGGVH